MMRNPKSERIWSVKNPFKQSRKIEFGAYKMKLWLTKKGSVNSQQHQVD